MVKKKEDGFEMLARLIKEEGEEIRKELKSDFKMEITKLDRKMDEGFAGVNRRLDGIIQPQLDQHAGRIKALEYKTAKL